jgi:hypothetical protein
MPVIQATASVASFFVRLLFNDTPTISKMPERYIVLGMCNELKRKIEYGTETEHRGTASQR